MSHIHKMDSSKQKLSPPLLIIILVVAIALGSVTGFMTSRVFGGAGASTTGSVSEAEVEKTADGTPKQAGVKNTETFKDTAEGVLKPGGFEGEGSHYLERPGGESQNVYITSSTIDLTLFEGKTVSVLGQTFSSEKAGWLMDVGYIEIKE